jgi:transcriptional regulator with XRE-family HTH domain
MPNMGLGTKATDKSLNTVSEVLKHHRQELGLLQPDIAKAIGVKSADFISLVESGQRSMDLNRIPALARVLKLNAKGLVLLAIHEQWPEAAAVLKAGRTSPGLKTLSEEAELASKISRLSLESKRLIFSLVDHLLSLEFPSERFGPSQ